MGELSSLVCDPSRATTLAIDTDGLDPRTSLSGAAA